MSVYSRYFCPIKVLRLHFLFPLFAFVLVACARDVHVHPRSESDLSQKACSQIPLQSKAWDAASARLLLSCFFSQNPAHAGSGPGALATEVAGKDLHHFQELARFLNRIQSRSQWPTLLSALKHLPTAVGTLLQQPAAAPLLTNDALPDLLAHSASWLPLLHAGTLQKFQRLFLPEDMPIVLAAWKEFRALADRPRLTFLAAARSLQRGLEQEPRLVELVEVLGSEGECRGPFPRAVFAKPLRGLLDLLPKYLHRPEELASLAEQGFYFFSRLCPKHPLAEPQLFLKTEDFLLQRLGDLQILYATGPATRELVSVLALRWSQRGTLSFASLDFFFEFERAAATNDDFLKIFESSRGLSVLSALMSLPLDLEIFRRIPWEELNYVEWIFQESRRDQGKLLAEYLDLYLDLPVSAQREMNDFFASGRHRAWGEWGQRLWPRGPDSSSPPPRLLAHFPAPVIESLSLNAEAPKSCVREQSQANSLRCALARLKLIHPGASELAGISWEKLFRGWMENSRYTENREFIHALRSAPDLSLIVKGLLREIPARPIPLPRLRHALRSASSLNKKIKVLQYGTDLLASERSLTSVDIFFHLFQQFYFPNLPEWIQTKVFQVLMFRFSSVTDESALQAFLEQADSMLGLVSWMDEMLPVTTTLNVRKLNVHHLTLALIQMFSTEEIIGLCRMTAALDQGHFARFLARPETLAAMEASARDPENLTRVWTALYHFISDSDNQALLDFALRPENAPFLGRWFDHEVFGDLVEILQAVKQLSPR